MAAQPDVASLVPARNTENDLLTEDEGAKIVHVNIRSSNGEVMARPISRSFPKAKPAKLIAELERLLSADSPPFEVSTKSDSSQHTSASTSPTSRSHQSEWRLADSGNSVYTTLVVAKESFDDFIKSIDEAADKIQHHPHISKAWSKDIQSWIVGITSTTNQPPGLSMRDVRLADHIDELCTAAFHDGIRRADLARFESVAQALHNANMDAATKTIANPNSKCALHVLAFAGDPSKGSSHD